MGPASCWIIRNVIQLDDTFCSKSNKWKCGSNGREFWHFSVSFNPQVGREEPSSLSANTVKYSSPDLDRPASLLPISLTRLPPSWKHRTLGGAGLSLGGPKNRISGLPDHQWLDYRTFTVTRFAEKFLLYCVAVLGCLWRNTIFNLYAKPTANHSAHWKKKIIFNKFCISLTLSNREQIPLLWCKCNVW